MPEHSFFDIPQSTWSGVIDSWFERMVKCVQTFDSEEEKHHGIWGGGGGGEKGKDAFHEGWYIPFPSRRHVTNAKVLLRISFGALLLEAFPLELERCQEFSPGTSVFSPPSLMNGFNEQND